jgi:hypothetical protein
MIPPRSYKKISINYSTKNPGIQKFVFTIKTDLDNFVIPFKIKVIEFISKKVLKQGINLKDDSIDFGILTNPNHVHFAPIYFTSSYSNSYELIDIIIVQNNKSPFSVKFEKINTEIHFEDI